jgi:photosystem II stability/assembly factor-like uncharacterized protein
MKGKGVMKRNTIWLIIPLVVIIVCMGVVPNGIASKQENMNSLGNWTCWNDGTIDPCHNFSLNSVSMTSKQNGWSVGENGSIIHWNGQKWSIFASPTSENLNSVQMRSESDGWAVGETGTVLRWNGTTWLPISFPTTSNLFSISIVSADNVWVAGWRIFHWDGSAWSQVTTPNNYSRAISMVPGSNGTDGWAVGYNGSILRWNGSEWQTFNTPTVDYLYDLTMISSSDGWIVGNNGTFLHWDGSIWTIVPVNSASPISSVWEIDAASANDIWAIGFDNGCNSIWHWNGNTWWLYDGNCDGVNYMGITVTPGTNGLDAWVVGESAYLLHWNNSSWIPVNEPYTKRLHAVEMLSPADGWIGGSAWPVSPGDAFRWNGNIWSIKNRMDTYGFDFYSGPEGTLGWSVGVWGDINKWDGSSWSQVSSPSVIDLTSVDIISFDEAMAVGYGNDPNNGYQIRGVIAHYENSEWITVTLPTTSSLPVDVSMLSSTNGWLVGGDGLIAQWQSSNWQIVSSSTSENLSAIEMIDETNGWIVGANGTILHWDGLSWSLFSSPTTAVLLDVKFISMTDGWAVGSGVILHWDGVSWTQVYSPSKKTISSIAYASPYELWAVGYNGFILHYEFQPILNINYPTGAPGSFFTISGAKFPPDVNVDLKINGYSIGTIPSDSSGSFSFILSTALADEGFYTVTASVNPGAAVRFILNNDFPARQQEGSYPIFDVPAGLAATSIVNLPLISR